jgi:hypothetical protein
MIEDLVEEVVDWNAPAGHGRLGFSVLAATVDSRMLGLARRLWAGNYMAMLGGVPIDSCH